MKALNARRLIFVPEAAGAVQVTAKAMFQPIRLLLSPRNV